MYRKPSDYRFESEIQADVLEHFGAVPYMRIWRNNVGVAYPVSVVSDMKRAIYAALSKKPFSIQNIKNAVGIIARHRPVIYSVPGSTDAFAILTGEISTGVNLGRWCVIEFKMMGQKLDPDQITWRDMMVARGAVHILATCIDDVYAGLKAHGVDCAN